MPANIRSHLSFLGLVISNSAYVCLRFVCVFCGPADTNALREDRVDDFFDHAESLYALNHSVPLFSRPSASVTTK